MSNIVKCHHSAMSGAPQVSGTAGSLKAMLDAVLCDGWGAGAVDSVVISGGFATVTRAAGHPFDVQTVALISGATVSGSGTINGEQVVLSKTASSYTFATTATGTVSGAILHKVAPLGFNKLSGTNVGAYQITGSGGTGFWLRVDDTAAQFARVVGYETMSDVNTGTNAFPREIQQASGLYWGKSNAADSSSRDWTLLGDDRGFYLYHSGNFGSIAGNGGVYGFGDFNSLKPADGFNCFLAGWDTNFVASSFSSFAGVDLSVGFAGAVPGLYIARPYTGVGVPRSVAKMAQFPAFTVGTVQSGSNAVAQYPNPADGALMTAPVLIVETAAPATIRGSFAGLLHIVHVCSGVFANRDIVSGFTGLSGRSFRVLTPNALPMLIDNTGPWSR